VPDELAEIQKSKELHGSETDNPNMRLKNSSGARPDYSTMVLLIDDQAIVAQPCHRLLAGLPDVDLHYCGRPYWTQ